MEYFLTLKLSQLESFRALKLSILENFLKHKFIEFIFRTCRYKLNPVQVTPKVKTDANDKILDFIRSQPPLKPVSERVLPPRKRKESTVRELILEVKSLGKQLEVINC